MKIIRTLMVDDSPEFLEATGGFLDIFPYIEVVGQVRKGTDVLQAVHSLAPDLILLDLAMPDVHGFDILRQLKSRPDSPPVIILTLYDNQEYRQQAEKLDADGYILKAELVGEILPMINELFDITPGSEDNSNPVVVAE